MPKYKLTEEDYEDLHNPPKRDHPNSEFRVCHSCGVKGEINTSYSKGYPYLHTVQKNSNEEINAFHPYIIYCGYGSFWDSVAILLSPQDKKYFRGQHYCDRCLFKIINRLRLILINYYFDIDYSLELVEAKEFAKGADIYDI